LSVGRDTSHRAVIETWGGEGDGRDEEGTHNLALHFDMSYCSILIDITSTNPHMARRHIDSCQL